MIQFVMWTTLHHTKDSACIEPNRLICIMKGSCQ